MTNDSGKWYEEDHIVFLLHDTEIQCDNYEKSNEKSKMITAVSRIASIASFHLALFTPMRACLEPSNIYDWYEYINVYIHEYFKIVRFIKVF